MDYLQDRLHGVFAYNPFTSREKAHHRAICGPTVGGKSFFVIKDILSHLIVNPMVWVVDLSNSYGDLFEFLREEMPSETAIMRVSRAETSFHFNPFLLADRLGPVPEEQFEFCMGLLKLMAGRGTDNAGQRMAMRNGLAEFFNAYRCCSATSRRQSRSRRLPCWPTSWRWSSSNGSWPVPFSSGPWAAAARCSTPARTHCKAPATATSISGIWKARRS